MEKKDLLNVMTDFNLRFIGWMDGLIARGTDARIPPPPPPPPIWVEELIRLKEIMVEYQKELMNLRKSEHSS